MEHKERKTGARLHELSVKGPSLALLALSVLSAGPVRAQDNYEIQVYGAELVPVDVTMLELHSNYTFDGLPGAGGVRTSRHALHETVEVTHGFSDWLEIGFYFFTSAQSGAGWQWVGDHIRPRLSAPARWHWPVGVSLSQEIGYQRRAYSEDTWTWEIRPIVDKRIGRLYVSLNPVLDRALKGPGAGAGFGFSPTAQVTLDVSPKVTAALEYYGGFGPVRDPAPLDRSSQQIIPAVDLNLGEDWEFNFGVGIGLTPATDRLLVKMILGRRLGHERSAAGASTR
jgi:hypothetical protein